MPIYVYLILYIWNNYSEIDSNVIHNNIYDQ